MFTSSTAYPCASVSHRGPPLCLAGGRRNGGWVRPGSPCLPPVYPAALPRGWSVGRWWVRPGPPASPGLSRRAALPRGWSVGRWWVGTARLAAVARLECDGPASTGSARRTPSPPADAPPGDRPSVRCRRVICRPPLPRRPTWLPPPPAEPPVIALSLRLTRCSGTERYLTHLPSHPPHLFDALFKPEKYQVWCFVCDSPLSPVMIKTRN